MFNQVIIFLYHFIQCRLCPGSFIKKTNQVWRFIGMKQAQLIKHIELHKFASWKNLLIQALSSLITCSVLYPMLLGHFNGYSRLKTGKIISMRMICSQEWTHMCMSVCTDSSGGLESYERLKYCIHELYSGVLYLWEHLNCFKKTRQITIVCLKCGKTECQKRVSVTSSNLWPDLFSKELALP